MAEDREREHPQTENDIKKLVGEAKWLELCIYRDVFWPDSGWLPGKLANMYTHCSTEGERTKVKRIADFILDRYVPRTQADGLALSLKGCIVQQATHDDVDFEESVDEYRAALAAYESGKGEVVQLCENDKSSRWHVKTNCRASCAASLCECGSCRWWGQCDTPCSTCDTVGGSGVILHVDPHNYTGLPLAEPCPECGGKEDG